MNLDALIPIFLDALSYRDIHKVNDLLEFYGSELGREKVKTFFLSEVLSLADQPTLDWFWLKHMSGAKYAALVDSIATASAGLLSKRDFTFGEDYSFRQTQSGRRKLLLRGEAKRSLLNALPKERHSSLRLILYSSSKEGFHHDPICSPGGFS